MAGFSKTIGWVAIVIMAILLFKGSYPLLIACEVFQMVLYHFFVSIELPYNYSNMLIGLDVLNFEFMPNMVASLVPSTYESAVTPTYFKGMIDATTFFISSGQYLFLLLCYASWAIIISVLKNKGINKWRKLRRLANGVF